MVAPNYVLKVDTYNSACFFTHQEKSFLSIPLMSSLSSHKKSQKGSFYGICGKIGVQKLANSNSFLLCLAYVSHFFNLKFFLDLLNAFSTYLWPNYFPFCIQSKNFSVAKLVFLIYDTHLFFGGSVGKIGNYWKITTLITNTFKSEKQMTSLFKSKISSQPHFKPN